MISGLATQVFTEVHHIMPMAASSGASSPTLTADNITTATGNIFTVVGQVLNEIVTQPIFTMFFVSGLIFMGVRIIRGLKRT